ncbi:MAG: DUF99 family protein [Thaumarchaeota archaeon]|nr:DUF99 family protein [Nitrososphaerota archaeon]
MVLHPGKSIRAFGVAESFRPRDKKSVLAGVVMRTDLVVDGFVFGAATLGGDDATSSVLRMFRKLRRADINLILLSGCIISRYNIIDVDEVARLSGLPVVCLTYNESSGIERAIKAHFEHAEQRIERYRKLGGRTPIVLHTGHRAYLRSAQISDTDARLVIDAFTLQGVVPEPIRLARLLARSCSALLRSGSSRTLR